MCPETKWPAGRVTRLFIELCKKKYEARTRFPTHPEATSVIFVSPGEIWLSDKVLLYQVFLKKFAFGKALRRTWPDPRFVIPNRCEMCSIRMVDAFFANVFAT